jgi:hypothetical protein
MATKRKKTLKQLFKAWFKYQEKNNELFKLKWDLEDLANQTLPGTELIIHNDIVYRVTTCSTYAGRINYNVERIAESQELETIK